MFTYFCTASTYYNFPTHKTDNVGSSQSYIDKKEYLGFLKKVCFLTDFNQDVFRNVCFASRMHTK